MFKEITQLVGACALGVAIGAIGANVASGQFQPPPPPRITDNYGGFEPADRAKLDACYYNTKAIRGKLFPRVEDGTAIPLQ